MYGQVVYEEMYEDGKQENSVIIYVVLKLNHYLTWCHTLVNTMGNLHPYSMNVPSDHTVNQILVGINISSMELVHHRGFVLFVVFVSIGQLVKKNLINIRKDIG